MPQNLELETQSLLEESLDRAVSFLISLQYEEGYWLGELEADTTLESDYIFYLHVLDKFDHTRVRKLADYVRRRQLPDGGWNIFFGGPSEVNATVKAYFALKLAGDLPIRSHHGRAPAAACAILAAWNIQIRLRGCIWRLRVSSDGTWSRPFRRS